jgi:D-glycero-D-manno-heptose 1,7-bisphosphate phosphatase
VSATHISTGAVFVDRDGVINRRRDDYVKDWRELELLAGSIDGLARISLSGRRVFVLTNQSAIAQGLLTVKSLEEIHARLSDLVAQRGGRISGFLVCPHGRDEGCDCRKPAPGLLFRGRDEFGVNLAESIVVGDQLTDVQAAVAAGCAPILVRSKGEVAPAHLPDCPVVSSLFEAADLICGG